VPPVYDQQPIQAFAADTGHPAFAPSIRIRRRHLAGWPARPGGRRSPAPCSGRRATHPASPGRPFLLRLHAPEGTRVAPVASLPGGRPRSAHSDVSAHGACAAGDSDRPAARPNVFTHPSGPAHVAGAIRGGGVEFGPGRITDVDRAVAVGGRPYVQRHRLTALGR
jgi:hypothetical protein